jgi:hypothetical protein
MSLKISYFSVFTLSCSLLLLAACSQNMNNEIEENARYWQKIDVSDAIYQRGPKAQQMLFQDISTCTSQLNEMARLGALRSAIPPETTDRDGDVIDLNTPEGRLKRWDSPQRDGYLRRENMQSVDFETCMLSKGWERTKFVNYEVKDRSRDDYLDAISYERHRTYAGERKAKGYDRLNK